MKHFGSIASADLFSVTKGRRNWLRLYFLTVLLSSLIIGRESISAEPAADIRRKAEIAREEAAYLESNPVNQWAVENGKTDWDTPGFKDIYLYIPETHPVRQRGGNDPFGNPYVLGSVRQGVAVNAKTIELCAEVTKRDPTFWGHHDERVLGLIEAARKGDVEAVRTLVKAVPDPNIPNKDGDKALLFSIGDHNDDMEKILTSRGAIVGPGDGSPLWWAIDKENVKEVKALLDRFPSMATATITNDDQPNMTYQPALCRASGLGNTEMVRMLLEHGADPNTLDGYPLSTAAGGYSRIVKLLVEAGAQITPKALNEASPEIRKYLESRLGAATNGVSSAGAKTGSGQ